MLHAQLLKKAQALKLGGTALESVGAQVEEVKGEELIEDDKKEEKEALHEQTFADIQKMAELQIETIQFIADSTLIVATQTADIRVLHTHSFLGG